MWYFLDNKKQFGPISEGEIVYKINEDHFFSKTWVWQPGMENWQPAEATSLKKYFPEESSPSFLESFDPKITRQVKEINDLYRWSWICLILSLLTSGVGAMITFMLWYIILFRCWELIQDGQARTTPGKAVGFLFIPVYMYYWNFVAYPGWAKDANQYVQNRGYPIAKLNPKTPTAMCILTLLSIIPGVILLIGVCLGMIVGFTDQILLIIFVTIIMGVVLGTAHIILRIIVMRSFSQVAIELVLNKDNNTFFGIAEIPTI